MSEWREWREWANGLMAASAKSAAVEIVRTLRDRGYQALEKKLQSLGARIQRIR